MADEAAVNTVEPASAGVWEGKVSVPDPPPEDPGIPCAGCVGLKEADGPVPGAEGLGEHPVALAEGPGRQPIRSIGTDAGPFAADVTVVEGAKCAVRTLARKLAGAADSEATVPASAEVSSQYVSPFGAQWVMSSDLTPGTLYFVTYDAIQLSYFVDAYAPVPDGKLTAPREHGYA